MSSGGQNGAGVRNRNLPGGAISDRLAALGRWGYYASVSFTDYNVGIILDGLDNLGAFSPETQTQHTILVGLYELVSPDFEFRGT